MFENNVQFQDQDVYFKKSLDLIEAFDADDAQVLFLKTKGHRLSDDESLQVIFDNIAQMTHKL